VGSGESFTAIFAEADDIDSGQVVEFFEPSNKRLGMRRVRVEDLLRQRKTR